MRVKLISTLFGITALSLTATVAHAFVVAVPETRNCPVYSPCGPGMEGYNTGFDEKGCPKMGCRPEGTGNDETPNYDYPPGDGNGQPEPPLPHQPDPEKTYEYKGDIKDKNTIPPRAIDVQ